MVSRLFSGKTVDIYYGVMGTAIPTITPATGVITPGAAYSLIGQGNYADGVTFDHVDERTELMFQGGQGIPDEERRTKQGLMVTVEVLRPHAGDAGPRAGEYRGHYGGRYYAGGHPRNRHRRARWSCLSGLSCWSSARPMTLTAWRAGWLRRTWPRPPCIWGRSTGRWTRRA